MVTKIRPLDPKEVNERFHVVIEFMECVRLGGYLSNVREFCVSIRVVECSQIERGLEC